jgi:peptidyl-prolyl cis-trans isomerase A (cyclophilin A)/peptidyl-prolyl cis-trans isomerase B (cyclophilin B)
MSTSLLFAALLFGAVGAAAAQGSNNAAASHPRVELETSKGKIVLELYPDKAPKTVDNFLRYVKDGHFDNTIFHRVIAGFMIQGGGFTADMRQKPTRPPIPNEADNGLTNDRGTVAMARTSDPNSASGQFFINVVDNTFLNFKSKTPQGWGYTVFGKVVEGMDVADAIAAVKTKAQDVPVEPVTIKKAHVVH